MTKTMKTKLNYVYTHTHTNWISRKKISYSA